jgi:hypothetical protein
VPADILLCDVCGFGTAWATKSANTRLVTHALRLPAELALFIAVRASAKRITRILMNLIVILLIHPITAAL